MYGICPDSYIPVKGSQIMPTFLLYFVFIPLTTNIAKMHINSLKLI